MRDVTSQNFGYLIAYLLPGFMFLLGVSEYLGPLSRWVAPFQEANLKAEPTGISTTTIGGFLYGTLMSLAAGMTLSACRWVVVDTVLHHTGVQRPHWDDSKLQANLQTFELLVEHHYRYYQFYSNTLVGLPVIYAARRPGPWVWDVGFSFMAVVFFIVSRDTLHRYYRRVEMLLDYPESEDVMSNGSHTPKTEPVPAKGPQIKRPSGVQSSGPQGPQPDSGSKGRQTTVPVGKSKD